MLMGVLYNVFSLKIDYLNWGNSLQAFQPKNANIFLFKDSLLTDIFFNLYVNICRVNYKKIQYTALAPSLFCIQL